MQSDLALHFRPFSHWFWSRKPHLIIFNRFKNDPWFLRVSNSSLLKTLRKKEKLLVTSNFSFFHSVFYPFGKPSVIFFEFEIVRLQTVSVWKSIKLSFGKGINMCNRQHFIKCDRRMVKTWNSLIKYTEVQESCNCMSNTFWPNDIFQDSFNIILSQQLTHDRSYI